MEFSLSLLCPISRSHGPENRPVFQIYETGSTHPKLVLQRAGAELGTQYKKALLGKQQQGQVNFRSFHKFSLARTESHRLP
jgi:hypothetical protein